MSGHSRLLRTLHALVATLMILTSLAPVPSTSAPLAEISAAPVQGNGFIDPGDWQQQHLRVAGDSAGNAYAVWQDFRETGPSHIRFAYRPAGGEWGGSTPISGTATLEQSAPTIAVDGSGTAHVAWKQAVVEGGPFQIHALSFSPSGMMGSPLVISPSEKNQHDPILAANRRGEVVAAWSQPPADQRWDVNLLTAVRPRGGPWGAADQVTEQSSNIWDFDVDLDQRGQAYLLWADQTSKEIRFAERPPGRPWGSGESIEDVADSFSYNSYLAVDLAGNAHAVWADERGGQSDVYSAYRPAGGPWSANALVDPRPSEHGRWPTGLAVDSAGTAVVGWMEDWETAFPSFGAYRFVGSSWGQPALLPTTAPGATAVEAQLRVAGGRPLRVVILDYVSYIPVPLDSYLGLSSYRSTDPMNPDAPLNAHLAILGGPGSNGDCSKGPGAVPVAATAGADTAGADAASTAWPAVAGGDNGCKGAGPQLPGQNGDDGNDPFIGPLPMPNPVVQPPVQRVDMDGQTVWVVDVPGNKGFFTNEADAREFAAQQADQTNFGNLIDALGQNLPVGDPPANPPNNNPPQPPPDPNPQPPAGDGDGGWITEGDVTYKVEYVDDPSPPPPENMQTKMDIMWLLGISEHRKLTSEEQKKMVGLLSTLPAGDSERLWWTERYKDNVREQGANPVPEPPKPTGQPAAQPKPKATPKPHGSGLTGVNSALVAQNQKENKYDTLLTAWLRKQAKKKRGNKKTDPVLLHSGEFVHTETPLSVQGRGLDYSLQVTYHSQLIFDGPVGWGWEHSYDRRIVDAGAGSLGLRTGGGRFDLYTWDGTQFHAPAGTFTTIVSDTAGISISYPQGMTEDYFPLDDATTPGALRSITDRNGNALTFGYDAQGRLEQVTDTLGRPITYTYDANDRIVSVTDFTGRAVTLEQDASGDLVSITTAAVTGTPHGNDFPVGKTTRFVYGSGYDDERLNHNLTTIISPNEVADGSLTPRTINTYGNEGMEFDRVVEQSWGGGRSNYSGSPAGGVLQLAYSAAVAPDAPPGAVSKTTVTDRGGNVLELWHDGAGHRLQARQSVDGRIVQTELSYNGDGMITNFALPMGNQMGYIYDEASPDRRAQGNLLVVRRVADLARGCGGLGGGLPCPDLDTTYSYEPNFQMLQTATDSRGNRVTNTYDASGNLVGATFPDVTVGQSAPQSAELGWTRNGHGQPLTFTDAEGNITCYQYADTGPATGYLMSVTQDCGGEDLVTSYGMDGLGRTMVETDPRGVRTEYVPNQLDQLVEVIRAAASPVNAASSAQYETPPPLGYRTRFSYDANDNLVQLDVENLAPELDRNAHPVGSLVADATNPWLTSSYSYDLLDNVVSASSEVNETEAVTMLYGYDAQERMTSLTYPEGRRDEYGYDGRGLLTQITLGAGTSVASTEIYRYDLNGNLTSRTDGEGRPTDYAYDGFDRQVGRIDALGNVTVQMLDGNGNIVTAEWLDGQEGRNAGRVLDALSAVPLARSRYTYDERNRLVLSEAEFFAVDAATGIVTPIATDGDHDGWVETAVGYDRNSMMTTITGDDGHTNRYDYDPLSRLALVTDPVGNHVAFHYDDGSNVVQTVATDVQPHGLAADETYTTTYHYDGLSRLVTVTDNVGQTERYDYDSRSNLVFRSDAHGAPLGDSNDHGNTAVFSYDGLDRLVAEIFHLRDAGAGDGSIDGVVATEYDYDGNGNLQGMTDPNGNLTLFGYDDLDRPSVFSSADGSQESYRYDRTHNLVQQIDPNGTVIDNSYDPLNRLQQRDISRAPGLGGTTVQTYAWDGLSRLVEATDNNEPTMAADDSLVAWTYDSLSNPLTETQDGLTVISTFDGMGNMLSLEPFSGQWLSFSYDELNRLRMIDDATDFRPIAVYDYIGPRRVLQRTNRNGTQVFYAYDGTQQVAEVAHRSESEGSLLSSFQYTYDRAGNIVSELAQPGERLTAYSYDSLYQLVEAHQPGLSQGFSYDAAGNRLHEARFEGGIDYSVNEMNQYTTIGRQTRDHDASGKLTDAWPEQYGYDGLDRLIGLHPGWSTYLPLSLSSGAAPAVSVSGTALPDQTRGEPQVVYAYDAVGRPVSKTGPEGELRYIYGGGRLLEIRDGSGELLSAYVGQLLEDRGGAWLYYQADGQGSVRTLVDEAGDVRRRIDYSAFGVPSSSDTALPVIFRGRRYDGASSMYVHGEWLYDPASGRYLQPGEPASVNRYTFAENNPAGGVLR